MPVSTIIGTYELNTVNNNTDKEFLDWIPSKYIKEQIKGIDIAEALREMDQSGCIVQKYCTNRFKSAHPRFIWVDMEDLTLRWQSREGKNAKESKILFVDVIKILPGVESDFWNSKKRSHERDLGIDILTKHRRLRVVMKSKEDWKNIIAVMSYSNYKAQTKRLRLALDPGNSIIYNQWKKADLDDSGSIQLNELISLVKGIGVALDVKYLEKCFKIFSHDGSGVLEYDEFCGLIKNIMRLSVLDPIFDEYSNDGIMSMANLKRFFIEQQDDSEETFEVITMILNKLGDPYMTKDGLSTFGFTWLLKTGLNTLMDPRLAQQYHDMSEPLSSYYIWTAPNNAIFGAQNPSVVFSGIVVLLNSGIRCVELDVYDGPMNRPVCYYQIRPEACIELERVIEAITYSPFAFTRLPLIISLTMYTGTQQTKFVAEILKTKLKYIYTVTPDTTSLPAPRDLLDTFILMGKHVRSGKGNPHICELVKQADMIQHHMATSKRGKDIAVSDLKFELPLMDDLSEDHKTNVWTDLVSVPMDGSKGIARESLTALGHVVSLKITSDAIEPDREPDGDPFNVYEMNYTEALELIQKWGMESVREMTSKRLITLKHCGNAKTSTSHNMSTFFNAGFQIMGSCIDKNGGLAAAFCDGKFQENGRCGYLLKDSNSNMCKTQPLEIRITVKTCSQLPRPPSEKKRYPNQSPISSLTSKDDLNPYVIISVIGNDTHQSHRTAYVPQNGLNPVWNEPPFKFNTEDPRSAVIHFEARHYDLVRTEFLGQNAYPLHCIREGLRWIPLYDQKRQLSKFSGILVECKLVGAKSNPYASQIKTRVGGSMEEQLIGPSG